MLNPLVTCAILVTLTTYMFMVPVQCQQNTFPQVTTVSVMNELGNDFTLFLHCKSKDDDLGVHAVANGQAQTWSFRLNVIGTTLFWCNIKWSNTTKNVEIYNAATDDAQCLSQCRRSVRQDGIYYYWQFKTYWYKKYIW
ncbi:putative plant self-incompatibility S1 [Lupinus albus]|uniref:S-protein homolog n=1 Tax=Lupinus albus TaxID=3870 RepID=A0A6A4QGW6_LUPAL|nr:putative plant self-incompatibility S1 [Lupinus albus]